MLDLAHLIHILSATVFVGSVVFFDWAVGGAMARATPEDRLKIAHAIRPFSGPLIMGSLAATLVAGIARLFLSGAIQTFGDLVTGYGLRASLALVVVVGSEGFAAPLRKRMRAAIDAQDDNAFKCAWRSHRALNSCVLVVVLALMVSMRMGW